MRRANFKNKKTIILLVVAAVLVGVIMSVSIIKTTSAKNYNVDWMEGKPLWLIEVRYGEFDFINDEACVYFVSQHKDVFGDTTGLTKVVIYFNDDNICTGAQMVTSS